MITYLSITFTGRKTFAFSISYTFLFPRKNKSSNFAETFSYIFFQSCHTIIKCIELNIKLEGKRNKIITKLFSSLKHFGHKTFVSAELTTSNKF